MSLFDLKIQLGCIADTVLLPGDPLRAKYISENFLENTEHIIDQSPWLGFTGYYKGSRISVVSTGMGVPSLGIIVEELLAQHKAKTLIRVGTSGSICTDLQINDVVLVLGASTDSKVNSMQMNNYHFSACADFYLLRKALIVAKEIGTPVKISGCFTTDYFYDDRYPEFFDTLNTMGIVCLDMEAAGLYGLAKRYNAQALTILQISDHLIHNIHINSKDRETSVTKMLNLALNTAIYNNQRE